MDASGKQKWRIIVDFRRLNDHTVGDAYPLPNIEEILDQLGRSRYFTTLDLASGFHQIKIKRKDRPKTAFSTSHGHFEWIRMPFGLKNAPATFQRLMNAVLSGYQGLQAFVYLNDIIIYASDLEEHRKRLKNIFQRLRDNNLRLQPDKCEFLRKEVAYLGHVITEHGVKPNPNIKNIQEITQPQSVKQLQAYLRLVGYYRRFIKDFAYIAKPLTNLLKKDTPYVWSADQESAFLTFQKILTSDSLLQYPNF